MPNLATEELTRQTVNRGRLNCTWNLCPCISYQLLRNSPLNWAVKIQVLAAQCPLPRNSVTARGLSQATAQLSARMQSSGLTWKGSGLTWRAVGGISLLRGYWTEATLSSLPRVSPERSSQPGSWLCSGQIQGGIFLHPDLGHDIPPLLPYSMH